MPVKTKRVGEPSAPADGTRILVTRYRPRAVRRGAETWHAWDKRLAPSIELLDAAFGKVRSGGKVTRGARPPLPWAEFVRRFAAEMDAPMARAALAELRARAKAEMLTLLCYCEDEAHCHRGLLRAMVESGAASHDR